PVGGSGPPGGLREPRAGGPLDRELPLPPEGRAALRRGAGPDQPRNRESLSRRRLLLPRPDDPEGPHRAASLHRQLPDPRGRLDRPPRRGRPHREITPERVLITRSGRGQAPPLRHEKPGGTYKPIPFATLAAAGVSERRRGGACRRGSGARSEGP